MRGWRSQNLIEHVLDCRIGVTQNSSIWFLVHENSSVCLPDVVLIETNFSVWLPDVVLIKQLVSFFLPIKLQLNIHTI